MLLKWGSACGNGTYHGVSFEGVWRGTSGNQEADPRLSTPRSKQSRGRRGLRPNRSEGIMLIGESQEK